MIVDPRKGHEKIYYIVISVMNNGNIPYNFWIGCSIKEANNFTKNYPETTKDGINLPATKWEKGNMYPIQTGELKPGESKNLIIGYFKDQDLVEANGYKTYTIRAAVWLGVVDSPGEPFNKRMVGKPGSEDTPISSYETTITFEPGNINAEIVSVEVSS